MRVELVDFGSQSTPSAYCLRGEGSDGEEFKIWAQLDYVMT
jgi:hypothetical protein